MEHQGRVTAGNSQEQPQKDTAAFVSHASSAQYVLVAGDPSGFTFESEGTEHVIFADQSGLVHELYWDTAGWHETNASEQARTGTLAVVGNPSGYMFVGQGSLHAVFRGNDNHLHELYRFATGGWKHTDLTVAAGAPKAAGGPAGYVFEAQGTEHVVYRGTDNHIHELYWQGGNWGHTDASSVAGAPNAAGDPFGYMFDAQGTQHIVYRASDNHIHELYWDTAGWHHHDPTGDNGAPNADSDPVGYVYAAQGTQHVVYRTANGHIVELLWQNGNWSHSDLTAAAGAPVAVGKPSAYVYPAQATLHVMHRAADNNIHELYWQGGRWHYHNPTGDNAAPKTDGDPSGYMFNAQNTQHVVYRGKDNHVHEVYWQGGNWSHTDISYDTRAQPPSAPSGLRITGVVDRGIFMAWTDNSSNETGFRVNYDGKLAGFADDTGSKTVDPNFNSTSIGGLRSNYTYSISVVAVNAVGDSDSSNTVQATTPARTISAVKQSAASGNVTLMVTGNGFSPNMLVVIQAKSGTGQAVQTNLNAASTGTISTTWTFACVSGTNINVYAYEDSDPIGTQSNVVNLTC